MSRICHCEARVLARPALFAGAIPTCAHGTLYVIGKDEMDIRIPAHLCYRIVVWPSSDVRPLKR